jgi:hypothetical protein
MRSAEQQLLIRNALIDNYSNYAEGLDSKNWPLVRACFADEVLIDYGEISAATGGADMPRQTDDWMLHLKGVINGFDITRHTITNHRAIVSNDEVSCTAYLIADHVIFADPKLPHIGADDVVTVVGEYTNHYTEIDDAWRICQSALRMHYTSGNLGLFEVGAKRVAETQG